MIQADLNVILPEILLSLYAMLALLGGVYGGKDRLSVPLIFATAGVFVILHL